MDSIFFHGQIYTGTGNIAQAVAVQEGVIVAVGSDAEILALQTSQTKLIDLEEKQLLPGFIDSHCHVLETGISYDQLDLRGTTSAEEIIERGRAYIKKRNIKDGTWVVGVGFNHNLFDVPIMPTKEVTDAISTRHPILLSRVCNHVGTVNSLALSIAEFGSDTVISGGVLDKDANGCLTGVLREVALDNMRKLVPMPTKEELKRILTETMWRMNRSGLTSAHSNDVTPEKLSLLGDVMAELEKEDRATLRIFEEVSAPRLADLELFLRKPQRTGDGSAYFKIGNIKLLADGSLGGRTAYLREPYADAPKEKGVAIYENAELNQLVKVAHENGMQIAIHAIGDGALEQVLVAVEEAQKSFCGKQRHRVVHCQIGDVMQYERIAKLGMGVDIQPPFVATDLAIVEERLDVTRTQQSYAWKTLWDMGIPLGGGSDTPIEPFAPLWGIHCAVNRQNEAGLPLQGWLPEQRLTVEQAVHLYTLGAATLAGEEDIKGTIEVGKYADFAVLDKDIFSIDVEKIKEIEVCMTVVGGEVVYQCE